MTDRLARLEALEREFREARDSGAQINAYDSLASQLVDAAPALLAIARAAHAYLDLSTYDSDPRTWNASAFGAANGLGDALALLDAAPEEAK